MSSIGVFREAEIDGKPFLLFNFLSQTVIDSDLPLNPLFVCPLLRLKAELLKREENDNHGPGGVLPFTTSPYFPSVRRSADEKVQYLLDSDSHDDICKLPVFPLFWCDNEEPDDEDFHCRACFSSKLDTYYYLCVTCDKMFHKECVESPVEIKHPSYPSLSLQLYTPPDSIPDLWPCISCEYSHYGMAYHCATINLNMHPYCAMKPLPIFIDHPKRHPHSLTFFPKQSSLACNVCGVIKETIPTYVCARCVYVVHQDCIYFPYVIRISRHLHRISFTSSLPSGKWYCGVCRQKVDNYCGAYSCNKCDDYFVHSRCALRRDLWDGEELQGVPEKPEIVVEPFERIADGIILHFSHGHDLKIEFSRVYDNEKICQACVLPIYEGNYYTCMDHCNFILHETCANAPLKKHHPLHAYSFELKVVTNGFDDERGHFHCPACQRYSCGFVYESSIDDWDFRLDFRCASISEPFIYEGHKHPLFLALTPKEEELAFCQVCQEDGDKRNGCRKLICIECNYILCFACATLPYRTRYKHDKHILTFQKAKEASDQSGWCEVCETKIVYSRKGGFYACDDYCCTSLHVNCLLGTDPYMKPGQTIKIDWMEEVHILRNNSLSRPFCHACKYDEDRCLYRVVFEKKHKTFCSYSCATTRL